MQLDSVSVVVRAHYMPLFSRLGAYERGDLDRLAAHEGKPVRPSRRRLFEYWAHEASLLPVELQPYLRWRMARAEAGQGMWKGITDLARSKPELPARLLAEIEARGPTRAGELVAERGRTGPWWGWDETKIALEWLFWTGRVTASHRRGFERVYDLPERTLPRPVLDAPTPDEPDAMRHLLLHAARAFGVATAADLRDYWRLPVAGLQDRLREMVEAGALVPATVEGWRQPAYLHPEARQPRRATGQALLAPFDPLVWERARTERLFGFTYRIEIYTPAEKRQHGYYVLPFLLGDRLVARVDLKTERAAGRLVVRAAHAEPSRAKPKTAAALAAELTQMARWLGVERVVVEEKGDLIPYLLGEPGIERA